MANAIGTDWKIHEFSPGRSQIFKEENLSVVLRQDLDRVQFVESEGYEAPGQSSPHCH